jgi:hypothetical protein
MGRMQLFTGSKSITAAGTPEVVGTEKCKSVLIQADPANAGNIYIGGPGMGSTDGIALEAGQKISFNPSDSDPVNRWLDLGEIYFDGDNNGEKIRILREE